MADLASLVIKVDSTSAKRATNELGGLNNASKRVEGSVERMGASAKRASADFSGLTRALSAAAAAAAALKFAQTADQMTNLESRIRLTMQATEDYTDIQSKLNNIARGSVASLNDVGTLYARIAPSIQRLGGTQRESLGIVTALNAALRINGATTAETSSVITQFSQAMQSGILRGEEFNALNENASPLMDRLAKNLGKTRGELRAMAFDGQLTADVVANNILPSVAELEQTAASMGVTATAAFQDLTDDVRIAVGQIDDMTGATDALANVINQGAKEVRDFVGALREGNLSEQQQTMIGIAGAVAGMATAYAAVRSAIILATIAQTAFNVAVRSNPLIMGLSVVTAGIAAIYGYTQATDAAKSTTDKLSDAEAKLAKMQEGRNRRGKATEDQIAQQKTLVDELREKVKVETKAAEEAKKAAEEAAKTGAEYKTLASGITEESKKGKKAADEIGDAFDAVAEKIAKINMTDSESAMFDFAKLAPTPEQVAQMSAMLEQLELLKQAQDNAKFAMDEYQASVEAANQTVDDFLSRDIGLDFGAGFDAASQSIGTFVNAFEAVIEQQDAYRKAIVAAGTDQAKIDKINKANSKAQIKQYGDLVGAAKGFFKESSKGYKALSAAEQAFRVAEIALAIESFAVKTGLMEGEVLATFAKNAAIDASNAISAAISSMVGLPFPLNMAALAATVAVLAGLGQAIGGGGGGSSGNQAALALGRGEGTTLGDPKQASESISASIDRLRDVARVDLSFSARMLSALNSIDAGVNGFAARIFQFRAETGARVRGISSPEASLADVLAGQSGITVSATGGQSAAATANFQQDFVRGIGGVVDAIRITGPQLGMASQDIEQRINEIVLPAISARGLKKLKGDELAERINAIFSAAADVVAREALPGLDNFQMVGEGYFQTAVRVASGIELAESALDRLGIASINYTSIINTQGDVSAEIVRQSVLLADTSADVAGGFREIVQNAQGTGEELAELVLTLRDLQDQLISTGKSGNDLTTFMISAAGGLDRLTEGLDVYFSEFLTPAEQVDELMRRMGNEFARIGQLVPESTEDFRALVEGIDTSTEAGQRLYGQVIALAPAFSELQDALADVGEESKEVERIVSDAFSELRKAVEQAESELKKAYQSEQNALQQTIRQFDQLEKSLSNFRREIAGLIATTTGGSLAFARAQFQQAANRARLGDTEAMGRLPELGRAFAAASGSNATSQQDMLRDLAMIAIATADAEAVAGRQKTIAEQQLDALNEQVDGLININDSTIQVRDAINNLRALQSFENKAIADATDSGFAFLIGSSEKTLSAIESGTLASQAIATGINNLLTIQQQQAAADEAEAARRATEQRRLDEITALTASGSQLRDTVDAALVGRQSAIGSVANLQSELSLIAKNTETRLIGGLGVTDEGLLDNTFGGATPTGKNKQNMAKRLANFNAAYAAGEYAQSIDMLGKNLSDFKSIIDPGQAELQRLRQQVISLGGVPTFATGGMHSGGWRMVGENGPELEYTGPSRIFNAGQTSSMMDQSEVQSELSAMRAEMRQAMYAIAKNTGKTYEQLNRWDDGDRMNVRIDNELDDPALVRTVA